MPRNHRKNITAPPLSIIQANVNRSAVAHSLLLELAFTQKADVILVQEPWIMPDLGRRITKWHPAYNTHAPIMDWSLRPRVMSYDLRSRNGLQVEPLGPTPAHLDITQLMVKINNVFCTQIVNVYSAPTDCIRAGEGVEQLQHTLNTDQPALILGDFNLRYEHWDSTLHSPASPQARQWQEWCDNQSISLLSKPGEPTHQSGSTIDLVWATAPLLRSRSITVQVDHSLDTPSDHYTLWINLPNGIGARYGTPGRYITDTLDKNLFSQTLMDLTSRPKKTLAAAKLAPSLLQARQNLLDQVANEIIEALQISLQAAAKRSTGWAHGYQWWNKDCRLAARQWHRAQKFSKQHLQPASQALESHL